jgi:uncharacterized alkaline shock family protein YloU
VTAALAELDRHDRDSVDGGRRPAAERGELTIADRVVERIVEAAVAETHDAGGAAPAVLGRQLWTATQSTKARVSAAVDGGVVTATVRLSVRWPEPVLEVTRRVRERIVDRVEAVTALRVAEVDIEVTGLYAPARQRVR